SYRQRLSNPAIRQHALRWREAKRLRPRRREVRDGRNDGVEGHACPDDLRITRFRYNRKIMAIREEHLFTEQEYLAFERASERKHEFFRGRIYAMAGTSFAHVR